MTQFLDQIVAFIGLHPWWALAIVFATSALEAVIVVGIFVPSTAILIGAGTLIGTGQLTFWSMFLSAALGAVLGDGISYAVGRRYKENIRTFPLLHRYAGTIDRGERFFLCHGGKSVAIGRFVPGVKTIVPGVAGIMGMPVATFMAVNIVSAFAWAAAHLVPGVLIGRGLSVTHSSNPRLIEFALIVLVLFVAIWYGAKLLVRWLWPLVGRLHAATVAFLERYPSRVTRRLSTLLSAEASLVVPYALAGAALLALAGFGSLLGSLFFEPELAASDTVMSGLLQGLRNDPVDRAMTLVTMLGDSVVTMTLSAALVIALLFYRRWRLAGSVVLATGFAAIFVPIAKSLVGRARPSELYAGAEAFSFPSGHATLSATILGVVTLILAHRLPLQRRALAVTLAAMVIGLISLSRVYLGAHWPSDVMAGLLFGVAVVTCLAFFLQGRDSAFPTAKVGAVVLAAFLVVYPVHVWRSYDMALASYAVTAPLRPMDRATWREGGWAQLPAARTQLDGESDERFVVQTDVDLTTLSQIIEAGGWRREDIGWARSALSAILPSREPLASRFPLVTYDRGRRPLAAFVRMIDERRRLVLELWPTSVVITTNGAEHPLILASISGDRLDPLAFGYATIDDARLDTGVVDTAARAIAETVDTQSLRKSGAEGAPVWLAEVTKTTAENCNFAMASIQKCVLAIDELRAPPAR